MIDQMDEYKKLLKQYISFKSISTDKKYKAEMDKTVSWLLKILKDNGFKTKTLKGPKTNHVVFGEYIVIVGFETSNIVPFMKDSGLVSGNGSGIFPAGHISI